MDDAKPGLTPKREERLAAQLRANLHRRKQQARAIAQAPAQAPAHAPAQAPGLDAAGTAAPGTEPCDVAALLDQPPAKPALVKPLADG